MDILKALGLSCCQSCTDSERNEALVTVVPEQAFVEDDVVPEVADVVTHREISRAANDISVLSLVQDPTVKTISWDKREGTSEDRFPWKEEPQAEPAPLEPGMRHSSVMAIEAVPSIDMSTDKSTDANNELALTSQQSPIAISRVSGAPFMAATHVPETRSAPRERSNASVSLPANAALKRSSRTSSRDPRITPVTAAQQENVAEEAKSDRAATLAKVGEALVAKGQDQEAEEQFSSAIEFDPFCVKAWVGRGGCNLRTGAYIAAKDDMTKALEIEANNLHALRDRAEAYLKMKEHDLCILDFDAKLRLSPGDGKALFGRGDAKLRRGDKDGACKDLAVAAHLGHPGAKDLLRRLKSV